MVTVAILNKILWSAPPNTNSMHGLVSCSQLVSFRFNMSGQVKWSLSAGPCSPFWPAKMKLCHFVSQPGKLSICMLFQSSHADRDKSTERSGMP